MTSPPRARLAETLLLTAVALAATYPVFIDTYRSMVQSSPYRAIDWQPLGPTNITGRATDVAVAEKNGG